MAKAFLIVSGDTHVGSTTGLMPSSGVLLGDGNRLMPNVLQNEIAKFWDNTWHDLGQEITRRKTDGYKIVFVHMGDVVDNLHHNSTQVWGTPQLHLDTAVEMHRPIVNMCDASFQLAGTEVHAGPESELDTKFAKELDFTKYNGKFGGDKTRIRLAGALLDFCHHGPRPGSMPWTFGNTVRSYGKATILSDLSNNVEPPAAIFRAHVHRKCAEFVTCNRYQAHVFITPAWQFKTGYGKKIAHADHIADVGLLTLEIHDGRIVDPQFRLYVWEEAPEVAL